MITVLGASGYTGQLIAHALAKQGLPLRLAGRSASRLEQLSAALPGRPATLVVDISDEQTLRPLADTRVLVNCAGPFTDLGGPVVALAARRGLRYLDITNELGYVHSVYSRLAGLAQASGAVIVPACGFEVALADCAAALLASSLPEAPLDEVNVTYRLPSMGSSYGTRASALRSLATSWLAYRGGEYVAARPCTATRRVALGGQTLPALAFPSSETLTLPAHLSVRTVGTWMTVTRFGALYGSRFIPTMLPLLQGPVGWALRILSRLAARPPTAERRARMPFAILVSAQSCGASASMTLSGRDPYGLTADIIAFAASTLLERQELPAGVLAPAQALEPEQLLAQARRWGVDIASERAASGAGTDSR